MPVAERPGASIWYADAGEGAAVLLVHGGMHEAMTGERFWTSPGVSLDLVARDKRVLVPDRRWCGGRTQADFAIHTWDEEADDLVAVIEQADTGALDVIAGSHGCSAAIRLALCRPDLVRSLVLCWPATPKRRQAGESFIELAKRVEAKGCEAIGTAGTHLPWEAAAEDARLRSSISAHEAGHCAKVVRESANALLSGDLIRGVSEDEVAPLSDGLSNVWLVPSEPFNDAHDEETFSALSHAMRGARRGPATPEAPMRGFGGARARFGEFLGSVLSQD